MTNKEKFKAIFLYSLLVWLTSAFVGSILFLCFMLPVRYRVWGAYWEAFSLSVLFSLPSFLLLLAVVSRVGRRSWRASAKKLVVAAVALALTALAFLLLVWLVGLPVESLLFAVNTFYAVPLVAAIFIFRFPPVQPVGNDSAADELRAQSL